MGILEIVLLIAGMIIFTLSFLIPARKEEFSEESRELAQDEIKKLVSQEMDGVKGRVNDVVGEVVDHAVEKTERSLERLSNEKIMAVSDYSDTVIKDIHKNHEEVVFLYDMLNDKQTSLKNTVAQVNETVKVVEETTRGAEATMDSLRQAQQEAVKKMEEAAKGPVDTGIMRIAKLQGKVPQTVADVPVVQTVSEGRAQILEELTVSVPVIQPVPEEQEIVAQAALMQSVPVQSVIPQVVPVQTVIPQSVPAQAVVPQTVPAQTVISQSVPAQTVVPQTVPAQTVIPQSVPAQTVIPQTVPVQAVIPQTVPVQNVIPQSVPVINAYMPEELEIVEPEDMMSNNERILALHRQGKSEISIAKELGLGVGEVRLVINLYKDE
ncbi:MAG: DUF6115 domain-containing protein [Candidatus Gastranaerophilales bacterium]|nr:DUF6115 domain-containing protein [Candidatus Gastranaerophilales bacterium]